MLETTVLNVLSYLLNPEKIGLNVPKLSRIWVIQYSTFVTYQTALHT